MQAVDREVEQDLEEIGGIDERGGVHRQRLDGELAAIGGRVDLQEGVEVLQYLVHGQLGAGGLAVMDEAEVARGDGGAGVHLLADVVDVGADLGEILAVQHAEILEAEVEQLDVAGDDGERIVDVVKDAGVNLGGGAGDLLAEGDVVEAAGQLAEAVGGTGEAVGDLAQVQRAGH